MSEFDPALDAGADANVFDIGDVLSGRSYPEVEVHFYLDEQAGLTLARAERQLTQLASLGKEEEHDEFEKKVDALRTAVRDSRYSMTLRGLSNRKRQDLLAEAFVKFPRPASDINFGTDTPNEDREDWFSTSLLQAMCVKITNPAGKVQVHPDYDTIANFRGYAPQSAMAAVMEGVQELTEGVKAGFEAAAQDVDFLSEH